MGREEGRWGYSSSRGGRYLLILSLLFFGLIVVSCSAGSSNFRYLKAHEVESIKIKRSTKQYDPESVAREVLHLLAPENGHLPRDIDESRVTDIHSPNSGFGPIVVRFERIVDALPVWGTRMQVALKRDTLEPVVVSGSLPAAHRVVSRVSATLPTEEAFAIAINSHLSRRDLSPSSFISSASAATDPNDPYRFFEFPEDDSLTKRNGHAKDWPSRIRYRPVWYASRDNADEALEAAFYAEVGPDALLISAVNGRILLRYSIFHNGAFSYRVWARTTSDYEYFDGPQGDGFLPSNSGTLNHQTLTYISPNLITIDHAPFSGNDSWLSSGASVTTGNNVDAYADLNAPDGFSAGDIRPSTTSSSTFDRTYDVTKAPDESNNQIAAAVTQLFYDINWLHDWFYDAGFDEQSGNAQQDNYGRGGISGDPILAEGQDYSGTNNANMYTPADGSNPVMQMYKWDGYVTVSLTQSSPSASNYTVSYAQFGSQNFDLSGSVKIITDASAPVTDGCDTISSAVSGKIAMIDRGNCSFKRKVINAETAGAIGVLIVDNVNATSPPFMPDDPQETTEPTIPVLSLTRSRGAFIKALASIFGVTVTMHRITGIQYDGTIDNTIISHEWGHYLSGRLVPSLSNAQSGAMGEGWSDFVAMLTTVHPSDASIAANANWTGTFGLGAYATQALVRDSVYFGIRRYPYSTDMQKNPLTFQHITSGVPLPSGVPVSENGVDNAEAHNAGEVWCSMLWECYAALLRDTSRLTFSQAQHRMKNYLVASLKMTPADPTYTEARDALLAVARAADINDEKLFCSAFAKRGMGIGAKAPDRYSISFAGLTESFYCGPTADLLSVSLKEFISCDQDGIFDSSETANVEISVRNESPFTLTDPLASATLSADNQPYVLFPSGSSVLLPSSLPPNQEVTVSIPIKYDYASTVGSDKVIVLQLTATVSIPSIPVGQQSLPPQEATFYFITNYDVAGNATGIDKFQEPESVWSPGNGVDPPAINSDWEYALDLASVQSLSSTDPHYYWHARDPGAISDTFLESPYFSVGSGNLVIKLSHAFSFEVDYYDGTPYDGGVIEILQETDNQWVDVTANATTHLQQLGVVYNQSGNPLGGRIAFVGDSTSYPSPVEDTISVGTRFANQKVKLRFRIGADAFGDGAGWSIYWVDLKGINSPYPFSAATNQTCVLPDDSSTGSSSAVGRLQPSLYYSCYYLFDIVCQYLF